MKIDKIQVNNHYSGLAHEERTDLMSILNKQIDQSLVEMSQVNKQDK